MTASIALMQMKVAKPPRNYALLPVPEERQARAIILGAVALGKRVIDVTGRAASMGLAP